jgi:hypothetical protein
MLRFIIVCILLVVPMRVSANELMEYIDWIVANSTLVYEGQDLPEVEYVPQSHLMVLYYGPEQVAQSELNGTKLGEVWAVYENDPKRILIAEGFDDKPLLLHELVHFLQDVSGVSDACVYNDEILAHQLHHQWMQENGYEEGHIYYTDMFAVFITAAFGCDDRRDYGYRQRYEQQ